jgi:hypothetical protein
VLQLQGSQTRRLDLLRPRRPLKIRAGLAEALKGEREGDPLHVELVLPPLGQLGQNLVETLVAPETLEDEGRTPEAVGRGREILRPDLLDDTQSLGEAGETDDEVVELSGSDELFAPSQAQEDLLPRLAIDAEGPNQLKVLVGLPVLDATFQPDEHEPRLVPISL